ncbi:MAG: septal ring lytic transglycosylase RlpA family protein [Bacteroidetes bacterium]|nr:septal ring lytic transglycosylase RlpA family protein [Bacteroidota bacterium]
MIVSTRHLYSSIWLVIALLVATALFFTLPSQAQEAPIMLAVNLRVPGGQKALAQNEALHSEIGFATWLNASDHGRRTASGERYDHKSLTAAHRFLPFDTMVKVSNVDTDQSIVVRINDRLPASSTSVIALSGAAARELGLFADGPSEVVLDIMTGDATIAVSMGTPESDATASINDHPTVPAPESIATKPSSTPASLAASEKLETALSASTEASSSLYTLQIGSFSFVEGAQEAAAEYEEAWIEEVPIGDQTVYRVYFSRFADESVARTAQNRLWNEGQDSFLRPVGK